MPYPCNEPVRSRVFKTMSARVPCQTSVLLLMRGNYIRSPVGMQYGMSPSVHLSRSAALPAGSDGDSTGTFLTDREWTGVWVSNEPATTLRLEVDLTPERLADYEWVEERKPYREWLVSAALLNAHARVTLDTE